MPDQIYIGNFAKGLTTNPLPFNIDNDSFPTMFNFYSWRGRARRKRGTVFLGRLQRQRMSVLNSTPPSSYQIGQLTTLNGSGNGSTNLISTPITNITQATNAVVTVTNEVFTLGDLITISGVVGMTQINGGPYEIISKTATTITLNVNSSAFTAYGSGGTATLFEFYGITPGSISLSDGTNTYTDSNGILTGIPSGTGTINYVTGAITITGGAPAGVLIGTFSYFPGLPVMGLRNFVSTTSSSQFPLLLAFDTVYSYQVNQTGVPFFYDVNYYKGSNNPFVWSGQDFQLFWTTNYQGALWATNSKPGLHFVTGTYTSGTGTANITFNFKSGGVNFTTLVIGDKLWFNEWTSGGVTINGLTGTVSNIAGAAAGNYIVTFTGNQTVSGTGIAQLLTSSISGQDGIKWYDGDPTSGTGIPTGTGLGWVNFAPPLTATTVQIGNGTAGLYYLVGALLIVPFKDRLLFFNATIQTSTGSPITLQDTVIWSWNGTPYYSDPVPTNQTSNVTAYYVDQTGKGGYQPAGISQPIITVASNEDVLLVGFGGNIGRQTRFIYTGDDLYPFLFFSINPELGASSTFSAVSLDRGAITIGNHGIVLTTQQSSQRIDLAIPDSVFQIQATNNGVLRVNSERDFFKEWIYFSYPLNDSPWKYPTQTFLYNYREDKWAIFYENFTAHGTYRQQQKNTWTSIGQKFKTWGQWRETWGSGSTSAQFPSIVAGNPQGYVLIKGLGTGESVSGAITAISNSAGFTQITSTNHCVSINDYLLIQGVLGLLSSTITAISLGTSTVLTSTNTFTTGQFVTISGVVGTTELNGNTYEILSVTGLSITIDVDSTDFTTYVSGGTATSAINGLIGKVVSTADANTFVVDILAPSFTTVYLGAGQYSRLSQPLLQTKQFPVYWEQGRQVRLSVQKYLLDKTSNGQITVNINLSQDPSDVWNAGPVVPQTSPDPDNNTLIYSQTLFTCPESTNIGLTPANTNLQMPIARSNQFQIWHRFNTSLIGDTFQIGFTLSDAQMRDLDFATSEITLHGMQITVDKGPHLA